MTSLKSYINIILVIVALVLGLLLWLRSPEPVIESRTVFVPEINGSIDAQKPNYLKPHGKPLAVQWQNTPPVYLTNPVNDSLVEAYKSVKDSLERFKLYLEAIEIRSFSNEFNDSNIRLTVSGQVQGELLSIKPDYTILGRSLEVDERQLRYRLLAGATIQNNLSFDDFHYSLNLGVQRSDNSIIRFGYARQYQADYFTLGYDFQIFQRFNKKCTILAL